MITTLDRILIIVHWEAKYPLARVTTLLREGSDHNPLLLRFGENSSEKTHTFRFEKWWSEAEGFEDLVRSCCNGECPHSDPIDR
jgi:hypothetical protein